MGTASKAVVMELGITCDYSTDVIQSAISAAVRGLNVLVLASGGMADLVLSRVSERNGGGRAAYQVWGNFVKVLLLMYSVIPTPDDGGRDG